MKKYLPSAALLATFALLAGCSSSAEKEKHLALLADSRAGLISAKLPLESGPLSIMQATAKGSTIELMMVYNQDAKGSKPVADVFKRSVQTYCTADDTKNNLQVGLSYRIKMRNARGQLLIDELVTQQNCENN